MPTPDSRHLGLIGLLVLQAVAASAPRLPTPAAAFDSIVVEGIRRGAFPGAVLIVGRHDTVLYARGYGGSTWQAGSRPPDPDSTVWDVASLTKVVVTTTAVMLLVQRGAVAVDSPAVNYLPSWRAPGAATVTVRQLLTHTSGMPAWIPLHRLASGRDSALGIVNGTGPRAGMRDVVYSDLNAILLGELVAAVAGRPLDEFWRREVAEPLRLRRSTFRPPRTWRPWIAPTGVWHGAPIAGVVNDPNAHVLGGVAGHAGLFASGADLGRFARMMLGEGALPDTAGRLLRPEIVRAFTRLAVPARGGASARTLGWQGVPTGERVSSAGSRFGPRSYGHTGWTGTSLWIDPDRDLFVILLTNRAFAPRADSSFTVVKRVRGAVADAAARLIDGQ